MDKVDVVIVGAGLAGLACAWGLADSGLQTLVIERGDHPGAKNVTGGRLYLAPVRKMLGSMLEGAPFERRVVRESLTLAAKDASVSLDFTADDFRNDPPHSVTILRSRFDKWLGEKVAEKGIFIIPQNRVDDLIVENGVVKGVHAGGQEIGADVVVAADGALGFVAEKAGIGHKREPAHYAVGIKEIIELPREKIEDRFNLGSGDGAARFFAGDVSAGMMGGAFMYTNVESISLGVVVTMSVAVAKRPPVELHTLIDAFKKRPEVAPLISGGKISEYSAHAVSEAAFNPFRPLVKDGLLIAGDAAGFCMNIGITVRGMEYALASGTYAAEAIKHAKKIGDFSAKGLGKYRELLDSSFVMKDAETFRNAPEILSNPRIFNEYPESAARIFKGLFTMPEGPKQRLWKTAFPEIRKLLMSWQGFRDYLKFRKM
jgi:electron transfer flavoprotein-quinone oxidoreductase